MRSRSGQCPKTFLNAVLASKLPKGSEHVERQVRLPLFRSLQPLLTLRSMCPYVRLWQHVSSKGVSKAAVENPTGRSACAFLTKAGLKTAFENMQKEREISYMNRGSHLSHCLDYLRQGVTCAGDMTPEPTFELTGQGAGTRGVNGWNVAHQLVASHNEELRT
ncbi:hypothetical protein WAI453_005139 [Rhynchosporium graminicola]